MAIIRYDVPTAFLDGLPASNSTGSFRTDGRVLWTYHVAIAHWAPLPARGESRLVWDVPRNPRTGRFDRDAAPRLDSATSNCHLRAVEAAINPDGSPGPLYRFHAHRPTHGERNAWRTPTYHSAKGGSY
jgi:hypothetical protein